MNQPRPRPGSHLSQAPWDPDFFSQSTLFDPVAGLAGALCGRRPHNWPALQDYQDLLTSTRGRIQTESGATLQFVAQDGRAVSFDQQYEPRIYLGGEIQTRCNNWHDFFQVLIWCLFTRTKLRLNKLHYDAARKRRRLWPGQPNRSPVENAVTLFDECGAVIVSSRPALLDMIRQFSWKQLFWQQRTDVQKHLRCYLFGHALYEKLLRPYAGLTANALLVPVSAHFPDLPVDEQLAAIDGRLVGIFSRPVDSLTTTMFHPFPVLGMPGACDDNSHESYYDNTAYFRPGRRSS